MFDRAACLVVDRFSGGIQQDEYTPWRLHQVFIVYFLTRILILRKVIFYLFSEGRYETMEYIWF